MKDITSIIKQEIKNYSEKIEMKSTGTVMQVTDGVARVYGLTDVMSGELIKFSNGVSGMAMNLEHDNVGVIILGNDSDIKEGSTVELTGKVVEVPVGYALLGRVVNALGEPLDEKGPIVSSKSSPIEKVAPGVIQREEVNVPLQTGIKAIDSMVPIGRGQRELIIGDRQTGKTAICIDTILNQKDTGVLCVYVAIGQKISTVVQMVQVLEDRGAMDYTTVVVASASDSASLQYIAPYAGCTIAEEWMNDGKDVLIIYDDLSKHAVAYRTMSLILRRPPGREAYPGDVFYLHSRLLERSARLANGGSLTALPIIETQSGDISAYIPTNVISITDGQIYLESELFNSGIRPAINPGLSVSRVGGSAQIKSMRKIAGPIRIQLAQYRELAAFAQFGSELDTDTQKRLQKGQILLEVLKQKQFSTMRVEHQVLVLFIATHDYLEDVPIEKISVFEDEFINYMETKHSSIIDMLKTDITSEIETKIKNAIEAFKKENLQYL